MDSEYEEWIYFTDNHILCGDSSCEYNYRGYCTSDDMNYSGKCINE